MAALKVFLDGYNHNIHITLKQYFCSENGFFVLEVTHFWQGVGVGAAAVQVLY